jgi:hypothetical protein
MEMNLAQSYENEKVVFVKICDKREETENIKGYPKIRSGQPRYLFCNTNLIRT